MFLLIETISKVSEVAYRPLVFENTDIGIDIL